MVVIINKIIMFIKLWYNYLIIIDDNNTPPLFDIIIHFIIINDKRKLCSLLMYQV